MKVQPNLWDYKLWVISLLTVITLGIGGYTAKTLAEDVAGVKHRAEALTARQEVDDERFSKIKEDLNELKVSVKDIRDLLFKTHIQEAKKERPLASK